MVGMPAYKDADVGRTVAMIRSCASGFWGAQKPPKSLTNVRGSESR